MPAPAHHQLSNREHGTRVTVQDLFGNMPVRVKQRGMILATAGEDEKQMDLLQKHIVGLLLAWDVPVMLTLRSTGSTKKMIIRGKGPPKETYRKSSSSLCDLPLICSILSQANYIDPSDWGTWVKTSARTPFITIQGAISLRPAPSKRVQFIALGVHYIDSRNSGNVLYDEVNRLFASSSFGKQEDVQDAGELERRGRDRRFKQDGHTNKQLKGGGKGVDRWPKFSLSINFHDGSGVPRNDAYTALERESTLSSLLKVLGALVNGFLSDHHFRTRSRRTRKHGRIPNDSSVSKSSEGLRSLPLQIPLGMDEAAPSVDKSEKAMALLVSVPEPSANSSLGEDYQEGKMRAWQGSSMTIGNDLGGSVKLPSFSRSRDVRAGEWFCGWSRIKSGKQENTYDELFGLKPALTPRLQTSSTTSDHASIPIENSRDEDGKGKTKPTKKLQIAGDCSSDVLQRGFEVPALDNPFVEDEPLEGDTTRAEPEKSEITPDTEQILTWINPSTKATVLVNARTGFVVPQQRTRPSSAGTITCSKSLSTQYSAQVVTLNSQERLTRSTSTPFTTPTPGSWVSDFLKNWDNPVFKPTEESIPQVSFDSPTVQDNDVLRRSHHHISHAEIQKVFTRASASFSTRLSKESLSKAKVIAQVDKKFILVRMNAPSVRNDHEQSKSSAEQLIVLIDQHAADERIRVEELLQDLCVAPRPEACTIRSSMNQASAVDTILLEKPITFPIQAQDHRLFTTHCDHFAAWGILLDLSAPLSGPTTVESPTCKLIVRTLPAAIAERCRTDHKILIEMLRGEVWKREELGVKARVSKFPTTLTPASTSPSWLSKISSCPIAILDMLNSRSCRSAIMFNDVLTHDECKTLIARLARCVFPFQCAHGRPSMVPLMELGSGEGFGVRVGRQGQGQTTRGFREEWKRWRGKAEENGL